MEPAPLLSIVMVTHLRPRLCVESLVSLFEALAETPNLKYEILIGVNGPDEQTRELLKSAKGITLVESSAALTPAAFRNLVCRSVRGEWIFFVDDDARVPRQMFKRFLKAKARRTEAAIFGGPNLNPPESSLFQRSSGFMFASRFATSFSSVRYDSRGEERLCDERALTLCNLFVRTKALGEAPFPPNFICCEENWLLQNLKRNGWTAAYDPGLAVWHERRPNLQSLVRQIFRYGFGRGQIFKRRRFGVHVAHLLPSLCITYLVVMIGSYFISGALEIAWAIPFAIYLLFCTGAALHQKFVRRRSVAEVAVTTGLYPVAHASYGVGMMWGIVRG